MTTTSFQLRDEFIELHRLLKLHGISASGGEAKQLVASGAVLVDGVVELRKACKVRAGQRVQTGEVSIELLAAVPKPS
jgi:ribosome-associated protein